MTLIRLILLFGFAGTFFLLSGCSSDSDKDEESCSQIADRYWSEAMYSDWLFEIFGIPDDESTWVDHQGIMHSFAHHLPDSKTAQYYELIGKYDQFLYGWVDTDYITGDSISVYRVQYLECRSRVGRI